MLRMAATNENVTTTVTKKTIPSPALGREPTYAPRSCSHALLMREVFAFEALEASAEAGRSDGMNAGRTTMGASGAGGSGVLKTGTPVTGVNVAIATGCDGRSCPAAGHTVEAKLGAGEGRRAW